MDIKRLIATGLYSGYLGKAPGTCGTLVAAILIAFFQYLAPEPVLSYGPPLFLLLSLVFGLWSTHSLLQRQALSSQDDPQEVVIDEFAGYYLSLLAIPLSLESILAGFCLFRLFDIVKPPPIRRLENLPGAIGIMADDLGAGIYAGGVLYALFALLSYY